MKNVEVVGRVFETSSVDKKDHFGKSTITTKIKPSKKGVKFLVLVIDAVGPDYKYNKLHAIDALNGIGWCMFDDVKACLGKEACDKLLKYCAKNIKDQAKAAGLSKDM